MENFYNFFILFTPSATSCLTISCIYSTCTCACNVDAFYVNFFLLVLLLFPSLHASNAFNQYNKIISFVDEEEVIPPKLKKSVKQPETKARKEVVHVKERY